MENIISFFANLTKAEVAIGTGIIVIIVIVSYGNYRSRARIKSQKKIYWTPERLQTYYKNSRENPKKYGYTIFSSYDK